MKQALKPKSALDTKNYNSLQKAKVPSFKQHRVSQLADAKWTFLTGIKPIWLNAATFQI